MVPLVGTVAWLRLKAVTFQEHSTDFPPLKASQLKKLIQEKDMEEQNGKQNKTKDNSRFEECNQTWNKIIFIKHCAHTKL